LRILIVIYTASTVPIPIIIGMAKAAITIAASAMPDITNVYSNVLT